MINSSQTLFFDRIVDQISEIGLDFHVNNIFQHAEKNSADVKRSIKQLPALKGNKARTGIVISAGPSLRKKNSIQRIFDSDYQGSIIAIDAAYIACLKAGLIPDYVVTMDPNPTRMVRWFGDHDFEKNTGNDDYYTRQDLDVDFRRNSQEQNRRHIELVNQHGPLSKAIIATSAPRNVVTRIKEARLDMYWWNPLMDDPTRQGSLTRRLYEMNGLPCINTGGNVGTTAWIFANSVLKLPRVAIVGMDLGYYMDTPIEMTQTYYELIHHLGGRENIKGCFKEYEFPLDQQKYYTDPTYFWYRKNLLEMLERAPGKTVNCTEGGTLFGPHIECVRLDRFLEESAHG
ncbi:MAG: motility associated factor glycosyltransferase family protein [Candidatus Omnitrophica bacterium]|nr:motility associated factor glycosyltransferase family protein [Candidatus Omnitrophota bacterium]